MRAAYSMAGTNGAYASGSGCKSGRACFSSVSLKNAGMQSDRFFLVH
jgi:hypothetical protein